MEKIIERPTRRDNKTYLTDFSTCSDYDEDCKDIRNHTKCFLGGTWECKNGVKRDVPLADGVCPLM